MIDNSLITRALWNKSSAVLSKKIEWTSIEKNLSVGNIYIEREDSTGTKIFLLKINPSSFTFKIIGEEGPGQTIYDWIKATGCIAGINGGYFYLKDQDRDRKYPLGLIIKDSELLSKLKPNYSGFFFYNDSAPGFSYKKKPDEKMSQVLQSFPMIIFNGEIPKDIRIEDKKIHINRKSRRSCIGEDWDGNILFFISVREVSFFELGFIAGALGFKNCLALDGGASSQMCLLSSDTLNLPGMDKIPFGIGIMRK